MMKGITLRPYRISDLSLLHQIDSSCFPRGISYSLEELGGFIRRRGAFTLVADTSSDNKEQIIGFVVAHRGESGLGHIVTLDILAAWRRRQIGTLLMNGAEKWLGRNSCRMVYLEVAENNLPALRFYQKHGYRSCQRVEEYYSDGTAAQVMSKAL